MDLDMKDDMEAQGLIGHDTKNESTTLLNEVKRICKKLALNQVESLFLSYNTTDLTSDYTGSSVGQQCSHQLNLLDQFHTFCKNVCYKEQNAVNDENSRPYNKPTSDNQTIKANEDSIFQSNNHICDENDKEKEMLIDKKSNAKTQDRPSRFQITPRVTRSVSKLQESSRASPNTRSSGTLQEKGNQHQILTQARKETLKNKKETKVTCKSKTEILKQSGIRKKSDSKPKGTENDRKNPECTTGECKSKTGILKQSGIRKKSDSKPKGTENDRKNPECTTGEEKNKVPRTEKSEHEKKTKKHKPNLQNEIGSENKEMVNDIKFTNDTSVVEIKDAESVKKKDNMCKVCNSAYNTSKQLQDHVKETCHSQDQTFRCEVCGEYFLNMRSLGQHRTNFQHFLKCETCGKKFNRIKAFGIHQRLHKKEKKCLERKIAAEKLVKKFSCDICNETFTTERGLGQHRYRYKHYHKCKDCGKMFSRKKIFGIHCRKHENKKRTWKRKKVQPKQCQCNFCGKIFSNSYPLKVHMRYHTGDKPYMCDKCGKVTASKTELNMHKLIHSDNRPYSCDKCDKTFKMLNKLKRHQVTHTGVKPFKCTDCEKCFTTVSNMKIHIKNIHMGVKNFSCEICGIKFAHSSNMKAHLKNVHKKKKEAKIQADDEDFESKVENSNVLLLSESSEIITVLPFDTNEGSKSTLKNDTHDTAGGSEGEGKKNIDKFSQINISPNSEIVIQFLPESIHKLEQVGEINSETVVIHSNNAYMPHESVIGQDFEIISDIQEGTNIIETNGEQQNVSGNLADEVNSGVPQTETTVSELPMEGEACVDLQEQDQPSCEFIQENIELPAEVEIVTNLQEQDETIIDMNQSELHVVYQSENGETMSETSANKDNIPHLIYLYSDK